MFRDKKIADTFDEKGYVVIDADLCREVGELESYIADHFTIETPDFYYSLLANAPSVNSDTEVAFKRILQGFYDKHFTEHRTVTESFLVKPAHTHSEFLLHQDWSYTDEENYLSCNVWIPLADVNVGNGAMFFLPGSHKWFANVRSASLPTSRIPSGGIGRFLESVPLKKGQALLFNPAVFHGSHPNASPFNRTVVTATLLPVGAPFLLFAKANEGQVDVYNLDDKAFLRDLPSLAHGALPNAAKAKTIAYAHQAIGIEDLMGAVSQYSGK